MASIIEKLIGYVELARPHNLLVSALTTTIGYLVVASHLKSYGLNPLIPIATVTLVAAGGYTINDYYDADVDSINKPYRPIPSGRVARQEALVFSIALTVVGVSLSIVSGLITFLFAVANAVLVHAYSRTIKTTGFLGNIVVSLQGANSIVYGGLALSEYEASLSLALYALLPAIYAFALLLSREVVKTIEDMEADAVRGVKSLPRVLGPRIAANVAAIFAAFVVVISPIPYFFGFGIVYLTLASLTDIIIIYSIYRLLRKDFKSNPIEVSSKVRSIMKVAIFVGSMAFLIDALLKVTSFSLLP